MRFVILAAGVALVACFGGAAHATEADMYCYNTGTMPPAFVPCTSSNPLQTTGGGGGGGGAVTAALGAYVDGSIVTLGTEADAAWVSGSGTLIAIDKGIFGKLGSPFQAGGSIGNTAFGVTGALPAGTNILGKVGIDQTTDVTTNGVEIAPTAGAAAAITPIVSASAESSHVLKNAAGNLYAVYVTTGATAGYLMVFNATSAPGDGAVTPIECVQVSANNQVGLSFLPGPAEAFSTGITAVFSSTGCFTKTASATAFFKGMVK